MDDDKAKTLLQSVASYYSAKLAEHGPTAKGVDWKDEESQLLRFDQLTKVITRGEPFTVNDLGCGYGALYDYLKKLRYSFSYTGCDISEAMISAAKSQHTADADARYVLAVEPAESADYGMASGIFNVRLDRDVAVWDEYVQSTLGILDRTSLRGFAFNCLTSYSNPGKMSDYLYYGDPCRLFDLCKRHYSSNVALLHDYGLYEFTIIVRK